MYRRAASACKRRAKKDVARWSDAVCCNHRESNPGLLRTARENRERVDDFRRQEFHILGYPTSDRSACAILLRDDAIVLAGRYSTTRPWLPNVWTCFPDETKWDRDVYLHRVCTPLLSVMGRMGFSFGCGEQSTRSTPLSDAEQRNETQRTMGC